MALDTIKQSIEVLAKTVLDESEKIAASEAQLRQQNESLTLENTQLKADLAAKPVQGAERKGKIAKRPPVFRNGSIYDLTGLIFVEGSAPGTSRGSNRNRAMADMFLFADEESSGAFNFYQWYMHPDEMKAGTQIKEALKYEVAVCADTMDTIAFQLFRDNLPKLLEYIKMGIDHGVKYFAWDDTHTVMTRRNISQKTFVDTVKAIKDKYPDIVMTGTYSADTPSAVAKAYGLDVVRYQGFRQTESTNWILNWAKAHTETWVLDLEAFRDDGGQWTQPHELREMVRLALAQKNISGMIAYTFKDAKTDLRNNQPLFDALSLAYAKYWRTR